MSQTGSNGIPVQDCSQDLLQQADFVAVTDCLKLVERLNLTRCETRRENSAEHSWHLTLQAILMAQHASAQLNVNRSIRLLIVHDLVEIEAGDHWRTIENDADITAQETRAAENLFARLPPQQQQEFTAYWQEFLQGETLEAKYAHAMDALHPMILVWHGNGHGKTHARLSCNAMFQRKRAALEAFPSLWAYAQKILADGVAKGQLDP